VKIHKKKSNEASMFYAPIPGDIHELSKIQKYHSESLSIHARLLNSDPDQCKNVNPNSEHCIQEHRKKKKYENNQKKRTNSTERDNNISILINKSDTSSEISKETTEPENINIDSVNTGLVLS
jgi:hypothetical protein